MAKKAKKKELEKQSKTPNNREKESASRAYPLWAKLIIGLVITFWVSAVVLFTMSMQTCVTMVRQATDPAFITANSKKIATFEKLPEGFKYQLSASIFNANLLTLTYEPDGSGVMLWMLPKEIRRETARQLADNMAERGIPTISDEFKVEKKGAIPVAGEKLEYVSGLASDKKGNQVGGFIGCSVLKDQRALIVYGWTPAKDDKAKPASNAPGQDGLHFNMSALSNLLAAIKNF